MISLTIEIDADLLEAAKREAERHQTTVEQMVIDYLSKFAPSSKQPTS